VADDPRLGLFFVCSSCSCSSSFSIRFVFEFWLDEVSDSPQQRSGQSAGRRIVRDHPADSPFFQGSLLEVLLAFSDSLRLRPDSPPCACGQSARLGRTVRMARADSPPLLAGRSASAWQLCSLVRFLPSFFRASACASRNRS
jgi:hypothetical protein